MVSLLQGLAPLLYHVYPSIIAFNPSSRILQLFPGWFTCFPTHLLGSSMSIIQSHLFLQTSPSSKVSKLIFIMLSSSSSSSSTPPIVNKAFLPRLLPKMKSHPPYLLIFQTLLKVLSQYSRVSHSYYTGPSIHPWWCPITSPIILFFEQHITQPTDH